MDCSQTYTDLLRSWCIDPLAMKIRWKLKKHGVAAEDIMSVFSVEKPVCELLPLDEEQRQAPQVQCLPHIQ